MSRSRLALLATGIAAAVALTAGCDPREDARASDQVTTTAAAASPTPETPARPSASPSPPPPATPSETPSQPPTPTEQPTAEPVLERGDSGKKVRELQVRLAREDSYSDRVDGIYGPRTERAVEDFQATHDLDKTGSVDEVTWDRLVELTGKVTETDLHPVHRASVDSLDERCLVGRVICANKTDREVSWVIDGAVQFTMDARFGRDSLPTTNGEHEIYWKDIDHESSLYDDAPMPFSMFFKGGEAVHYSPEFKAYGYGGPGGSHGCVNTRDWELTERLYAEAKVGDKVVVYGEY